MKIGIDIDDTIATTFEDMTPSVLADFHLKKEDINYKSGGYYPDVLGLSSDVFHTWARENYDTIIPNIGVKRNCKEVLEYLKEQGLEIILITARSNLCFSNPEKTTKTWLYKNKIPYSKLIVSANDKKQICKEEGIHIFIDDSIETCTKVAELGINVYVMNSKLNQFSKTNLKRVSNWLEIKKLIKEE